MSLRHLYIDLESLNIYPDISIKKDSAYGYINITSSSIVLRKGNQYWMKASNKYLIVQTPWNVYKIHTKESVMLRDVVHREIQIFVMNDECKFRRLQSFRDANFTWNSIMNIFRNIHKIKSVNDLITLL